jgi:hypothetical protein
VIDPRPIVAPSQRAALVPAPGVRLPLTVPAQVARQDNMLRGVMIHNYRMAKTLG